MNGSDTARRIADEIMSRVAVVTEDADWLRGLLVKAATMALERVDSLEAALRKLLEHAQRPSAHQVWLEQENERLQKRVDALTEALGQISRLPAYVTTQNITDEDGFEEAVAIARAALAAVGVPPEQTP